MNKNVRSILAIILAVILVALVGTYAILKVRSRNDKVPDGTSGESQSESRSAEVTASESEVQSTAAQTEKPTAQKTTNAPSGGNSEYEYAYAGFAILSIKSITSPTFGIIYHLTDFFKPTFHFLRSFFAAERLCVFGLFSSRQCDFFLEIQKF